MAWLNELDLLGCAQYFLMGQDIPNDQAALIGAPKGLYWKQLCSNETVGMLGFCVAPYSL